MPDPPRPGVIRIALALYVPMIACAVFARPPGGLRAEDALRLGGGLAVALGIAAAVVLGSQWASRRTAWGRDLRAEFARVLGPLGSGQILTLALLSAFGEEVLFRGVLQPRIGLWLASLLFGLLHFPVRRGLWPWSLFALLIGGVLGALTEWAGSLWPAIVLHFAVNFFNLHDLAAAAVPETPRPPAPRAPP